jgi:transposase
MCYNSIMKTQEINLPSEIALLQEMVTELQSKLANFELENKLLHERIRALLQSLYGSKSEKSIIDDGFTQPSLFEAPCESEPSQQSQPEGEIDVPAHTRKKSGRQSLPEHLEREEVIYDLTEKEKVCACGYQMDKIGEEVSEKLEMVPAKFWVKRIIRPKYACKHCEGVDGQEGEGAVKTAPMPPQLIPKSITTPSLLAAIVVSKFCDSLPLYRQESQFLRLGISISRGSMCMWMIRLALLLSPVIELFKKWILEDKGGIVNIDETTIQVLKEPNRRATNKSYMWVMRGGPPGKPVIVFRYDPSRGGGVAQELLGKFQGYIQTDGYGGYNFLEKKEGVIHVGCWAHMRRKFADVKKLGQEYSSHGLADEAIEYIRRLYRIESELEQKQCDATTIKQERHRLSKPIIDLFETWLKENVSKTLPQGELGKAFRYALNQWPLLVRYIDNGNLRMDNNLVENAIRPFALGRKNWLFSDTPAGADASATLYSLVETAKANGLEPYRYLKFLFEKLPLVKSNEELKALLPQNIDPKTIN